MRNRPTRGFSLAAFFMVVSVVLSACVDSSDEAPITQSDEGVTGIHGMVVSDEVFPVEGANVSVQDGPATLTDAEGRFELLGVEPGRHTIRVKAEGYDPLSQDVEVDAGSVIEVLLTVIGIPGQSPYYLTIPFEGFVACTFSAVYTAGPFPPFVPVPCPFGDRQINMSVHVGADWAAGVHEMAWETSEEMIMASSLANSCLTGTEADPCPYLGWGPSPIRVFARINDTEYAAKHAIDGNATWPAGKHVSHLFTSYSGFFRSEINATAYPVCVEINRQFNVPEHWGCPFGVGYSTGLRFTMYHTTFYHQAPSALEAFTAIPDE